ncbi:MAG TPA: BON domain-containing protein [Trichocoleus sp.]
MVSLFEVLVLILSVMAVVTLALPRRVGAGLAAIALATVMVIGFSSSAQAAGAAQDAAISSEQRELNNDLESTPNGNQFHGIEYADVKGTPLSDAEIERKIRSDVSDEIATSVSNGAVRLSGEVKNKRVAERIVNEVKQIPGVHEITFDLGLEDKNTELQR